MIPPNSKDPHGDKSGSELRGNVLEALHRHRVNIIHHGEGKVLLETDENSIEVILPEVVGGMLIRQISRALGIPIADLHVGQKSHIQ
jgi:hypothetical protein